MRKRKTKPRESAADENPACSLAPVRSSVGCGPSAQQRKAKSPECLAAKNEAAERQAQARLVDAEIRARDQTKRRELTNLRLDDQIARLEGRPIKNLKAEALIESSISIDELARLIHEE
jgi:hypothetical protein